jgi:hypothetical protein
MTAVRPSKIVLAVDCADLAGFCERVRVSLEATDADVVDCDVSALAPDAAAIDALARLRLTVRRLGRELRLSRASCELEELLAFAGLADVLLVEAGGQAEQREQRVGVEKERELDDPPC